MDVKRLEKCLTHIKCSMNITLTYFNIFKILLNSDPDKWDIPKDKFRGKKITG